MEYYNADRISIIVLPISIRIHRVVSPSTRSRDGPIPIPKSILLILAYSKDG